MNNQDKIAEEMASLVLDVYRYALDNNLDITNQEEVKKAVDTLKPELAQEIDIDTLVQGLIAFDRMTKTELAKRVKPN